MSEATETLLLSTPHQLQIPFNNLRPSKNSLHITQFQIPFLSVQLRIFSQWSAQKLRSAAATRVVPSKTRLRNRSLAF